MATVAATAENRETIDQALERIFPRPAETPTPTNAAVAAQDRRMVCEWDNVNQTTARLSSPFHGFAKYLIPGTGGHGLRVCLECSRSPVAQQWARRRVGPAGW